MTQDTENVRRRGLGGDIFKLGWVGWRAWHPLSNSTALPLPANCMLLTEMNSNSCM